MQNNLKMFRRMRGLNQSQLASIVGSSKTHISDLETGNYLPSLKFAYMLSFALGVSIYNLFTPDINETCIKKLDDKGVNI